MEFTLPPIGVIHSCFKEKFGIPRQPGLVPQASAEIEIFPPYDDVNAFNSLETFSHIWVIFIFHACKKNKWKSTVRPPRLGGNKRIGVFASRSYYRPNPVGLSLVELESIDRIEKKIILKLKGGDFLDGTPVIDIKPYIPYSDSTFPVEAGYAEHAPADNFKVVFSNSAETTIQGLTNIDDRYKNFKDLITQILSKDPRPGYYTDKSNKKHFGIRLHDYNIKWEVSGDLITVTALKYVKPG